MSYSFEPIAIPAENDSLIQFLSGDEWPFHVNVKLSPQKIQSMLEVGFFSGTNHECFWILDSSNERVGFIRLFDLDDVEDGYPLFDLRIKNKFRGQGIGILAVKWLTNYLFEKYKALDRIAGTTRADNLAMRSVFKSCGFAKEGHYRKDWPMCDGALADTVKYSILRQDWLSGKITPVNWQD